MKIFALNPVIGREARQRWRRPLPFVQIAGVALATAAIFAFLAWRMPLDSVTVGELRREGAEVFEFYRFFGGLLLFATGLLIGISSMMREREGGTYEMLLLSPLEPRGVVVGKVLSSAAFLLVFQLALVPVLIWGGFWLLRTPGEVLGVAAGHFLLTLQGATLGVLASVRNNGKGSPLLDAFGLWFGLGLWFLGVAFLVGLSVFLCCYPALLLSALVGAVGTGMLGVSALFAWSDWFLLPQLAGALVWAKWAIWQMQAPERDLSLWITPVTTGPTSAPLSVENLAAQVPLPSKQKKQVSRSLFSLLLFQWTWKLAPETVAQFLPRSMTEWAREDSTIFERPMPGTSKKPSSRLRLLQTQWLEKLNPVFWLDLQRCLSLRSASSSVELSLLVFAGIGGSMVFSVTLAILVSLSLDAVDGAEARASVRDVSSLSNFLLGCLFYGALACGTFLGAQGFVVERRAGMLDELRLTLLSARELLWGKIAARVVIPLVAGVPVALLIGFFAFHQPELSAWAEIARGLSLFFVVCLACALVPLTLSFHAPTPLAASLWSLTWGAALVFSWQLGTDWAFFSPLRALGEPHLWFSCFAFYSLIATVSASYLYGRLRGAGFG